MQNFLALQPWTGYLTSVSLCFLFGQTQAELATPNWTEFKLHEMMLRMYLAPCQHTATNSWVVIIKAQQSEGKTDQNRVIAEIYQVPWHFEETGVWVWKISRMLRPVASFLRGFFGPSESHHCVLTPHGPPCWPSLTITVPLLSPDIWSFLCPDLYCHRPRLTPVMLWSHRRDYQYLILRHVFSFCMEPGGSGLSLLFQYWAESGQT